MRGVKQPTGADDQRAEQIVDIEPVDQPEHHFVQRCQLLISAARAGAGISAPGADYDPG
jgi:hypothetical protein